jgi:hypothetical protein
MDIADNEFICRMPKITVCSSVPEPFSYSFSLSGEQLITKQLEVK